MIRTCNFKFDITRGVTRDYEKANEKLGGKGKKVCARRSQTTKLGMTLDALCAPLARTARILQMITLCRRRFVALRKIPRRPLLVQVPDQVPPGTCHLNFFIDSDCRVQTKHTVQILVSVWLAFWSWFNITGAM
jgi:hypothetical protein